jgi:hypothetical protein
MQSEEFGFDDEIVEIGQPIGDETVKFGPMQKSTFRDADLLDQFLIGHVAVLSQAVAIEFRKETFPVGQMRKMEMEESFQFDATGFERLETSGKEITSFVVTNQIAADLLAFKHRRHLEDGANTFYWSARGNFPSRGTGSDIDPEFPVSKRNFRGGKRHALVPGPG